MKSASRSKRGRAESVKSRSSHGSKEEPRAKKRIAKKSTHSQEKAGTEYSSMKEMLYTQTWLLRTIADFLDDPHELRVLCVAMGSFVDQRVLHELARKKIYELAPDNSQIRRKKLPKLLDICCQLCWKVVENAQSKRVKIGVLNVCKRCNLKLVRKSDVPEHLLPFISLHFGCQITYRKDVEEAESIIEEQRQQVQEFMCTPAQVMSQLEHDLGPLLFSRWTTVLSGEKCEGSKSTPYLLITKVGVLKALVKERLQKALDQWYRSDDFETARVAREHVLGLISDVEQIEAALMRHSHSSKGRITKRLFTYLEKSLKALPADNHPDRLAVFAFFALKRRLKYDESELSWDNKDHEDLLWKQHNQLCDLVVLMSDKLARDWWKDRYCPQLSWRENAFPP